MPKLQAPSWQRAGAFALPRLRYRVGSVQPSRASPVEYQYGHVHQHIRRTSNSAGGVSSIARAFGLESKGGDDVADQAGSTTSLPPPKGALSIVFTDIVKSTAIWEENASAMASAMKIHDATVRDLLTKFHGYEVKQNGDGFMLAFQTASAALQFCLAAQQQLLDQNWPKALVEQAPASREVRDRDDNSDDGDGRLLFRGLRLRMSAHWGTPRCSWNDVIARMDYLGPVANRAARFIQATEGGQLVVSEEFLREIQHSSSPKDATEEEGEFEVRQLGNHHFKGLEEPQTLFFIVPRALKGRLAYWPRHKYVAGSKGNITESDTPRRSHRLCFSSSLAL